MVVYQPLSIRISVSMNSALAFFVLRQKHIIQCLSLVGLGFINPRVGNLLRRQSGDVFARRVFHHCLSNFVDAADQERSNLNSARVDILNPVTIHSANTGISGFSHILC